MTPQELAQKLNGREYGSEITKKEERAAKDAGLVVVFGASDDLIEFRGAISDEEWLYDGGKVYVSRDKLLPTHECDCEHCTYESERERSPAIDCEWSHNGYSWFISAEFQYAPFDVMEDGEKYCRGIVYSVSDLPVSQSGAMFIVGMYRDGYQNWEFVGLYNDRDAAIKNCPDYRFFVAPAIMNETAPEQRANWEGAFYPHKVTE